MADIRPNTSVEVTIFGAFCKLLRIEEFAELIAVLRFGAKPLPEKGAT